MPTVHRNYCDGNLVCERPCGNVVPHKLLEPDRVPGQPLPPFRNTTMRMTHAEGRAWYSALMGARRYLEWGAGGTTVLAAWRSIHPTLPSLEAHTVESSRNFIENLREGAPLQVGAAEARAAAAMAFVSSGGTMASACALTANGGSHNGGSACENSGASGLSVHLGELGTVGEWGTPKGVWRSRPADARFAQAKAYVVWPATAGAGRCCFDTILIDGRFRYACALQALRLSHAHTTVLVHDFHSLVQKRGAMLHRGRGANGASFEGTYQNISLWYDAMQRVHTLAVLRPKLAALEAAKRGDWTFEQALREAMDDPS